MAPQLLAHPRPVEDVVPEHEGHVVVADVLLSQEERLGETVGGGLLHIGEGDPELGAVPQKALELAGVVGVVITRMSLIPARMSVESG